MPADSNCSLRGNTPQNLQAAPLVSPEMISQFIPAAGSGCARGGQNEIPKLLRKAVSCHFWWRTQLFSGSLLR
jgi:hypothetical protein